MNTTHHRFGPGVTALALLLSTLSSQLSTCFAQGSLTPPGAPAPTMKTLQQIEPRIDVNKLSGDVNSEVIISNAGSYYLSANLTVTKSYGITIAAAGVTLDLNGFEIAWVVGSGDVGIRINSGSDRATVRNGTIRGFNVGIDGTLSPPARGCLFEKLAVTGCFFSGINAGESVRVMDCRAYNNPGSGIVLVGDASVISGCTAQGNQGAYAIYGGNGSTISGCTAQGNQGAIRGGGGSIISGCTALGNHSDYGIYGGSGSTISGCAAYNNVGAGSSSYGIYGNAGSTIIGCASWGNSNTTSPATANQGVGIFAEHDSTVKDCTAQANKGDGIQLENGCTISGCTSNGNGSGTTGSGIATGVGGLVTGCTTKGNKADGIKAGANCTLGGCTANANGSGTSGSGISTDIRAMVRQCNATDNQKNGIVVLGESIVVENRASHNGQGGAAAGIDTTGGSGSRIEGNQARDNTGTGIIASGGDIVLRNSAGNNTVANFNPASGTNFAPVQSPATATNPLANIIF